MKRGEFPPSYRRVLIEIAKNGSGIKLRLAKKLKLGYSTVYLAITDMHRRGLLQIRSTKRMPTGIVRHTYGLTVGGLIEAIRLGLPEADLRALVKANRRLVPKVFGEWQFFKDRGVEEIALRRLRLFEGMPPRMWEVKKGSTILGRKLSMPDFFAHEFYSPASSLLSDEEFERFISACSHNPRIVGFVDPWWAETEESWGGFADLIHSYRMRLRGESRSTDRRPTPRGGGENVG